MKVHSVITIQENVNGDDAIADILLVTDDAVLAQTTTKKVENREPIEGLDYDLLVEFDAVQYVTHELNEVIQNT